MHPPLAKWLISIGFTTGHFTPTTWRISSLVAGALVVVIVYAVVFRLTRSLSISVAAAVFILSDGVAHVAGRYALLDGFTALFTTALIAMVISTCRRTPSRVTAASLGALSGLGLATKWSALPIVALAFGVLIARCRHDLRQAAVLGASFVGLLTLSYFATYAPWVVGGADFGNCTTEACRGGPVDRLVRLPAIQADMLSANVHFSRRTGETSPGWQWAAEPRSMVLFDERCAAPIGVCDGRAPTRVRVNARTNVVLWIASLVTVATWLLRRLRQRRGALAVATAASSAIAFWVPWATQRTAYQYYAAPIVPLLVVALVVGLHDMTPRRASAVSWLLAVVSLVTFVVTHSGTPWSA
jgi:predicted membrane-bound dolichyl-phosphate-mannose-protein mannosyltransferase